MRTKTYLPIGITDNIESQKQYKANWESIFLAVILLIMQKHS